MASIQEIKQQIQTANAIGRANLAEKDVVLAENATMVEIMQGIKDISTGSGSGGISLGTNSVVYNAVPVVTTQHTITIPTMTNETEVNNG